jgi:catechol 1,2-dioxygenase
VKESLIVDFTPLTGDPKAQYELRHEFRIASLEDAEKFSVKATVSS